jgi:arginine N-succinyltransferase
MFLVRHAKRGDVSTLAKLARMVYFINLPADEKILNQKVEGSRDAFRRAAADAPMAGEPVGSSPSSRHKDRRPEAGAGLAAAHKRSDVFVFVIEELETKSVVGTSQLISRMGGPGDPNYSLRLSERRFYSTTLNFGTTHTVARLYPDETGPTEVGGLILQPSLRGHAARPGRFISWVRFHFMGVYRSTFPDRVVAEMAPPVSPDGDNLFWDHIGRKFIPVKYAEADRFCQYNRKFIEELLPKDDIYLTLLPLEVLNHVAQVSAETIPARKMLERQGFKYKGFIDPFDGGPHIEADTDRIPLVADSLRADYAGLAPDDVLNRLGIVSTMTDDGDFRAVETPFLLEGKTLKLPKKAADALHPASAEIVGVTPYPASESPQLPARAPAKAKKKKRRGRGPAGSDGV